jgi:hypothetical protein
MRLSHCGRSRATSVAVSRMGTATRYMARIFMYRMMSGSIFMKPNRMMSAITQRITVVATVHLAIAYLPV